MIPVDPHVANRLIQSGPVMILSTRQEQRTNFMAVSWVTWLSCDPPLLGVSVTPSCYSHGLMRATGEFVLNVPDSSMVKLVHQLGNTTGHLIDKTRVFDIATHWGRTVKPLTLSQAVGSLECEVQNYERHGDHGFFIARVLFATADEELWDGRWKDGADLLYYLGGDRYQCGGEILRPQSRTDYLALRELQLRRELDAGQLFDSPTPTDSLL